MVEDPAACTFFTHPEKRFVVPLCRQVLVWINVIFVISFVVIVIADDDVHSANQCYPLRHLFNPSHVTLWTWWFYSSITIFELSSKAIYIGTYFRLIILLLVTFYTLLICMLGRMALEVIRRLILFLKKSRVRLSYHWPVLYGSLISIIKYIVSHVNQLEQRPHLQYILDSVRLNSIYPLLFTLYRLS
jgi:uncharacterized membrane protein